MNRLPGIILFLVPLIAAADVVVPVEAVTSHVNIRLSRDAASDIVGRLAQGDYLPFVQSTGGWHEVEITGGATGYVSADWSTVLAEPPEVVDVEAAPETSAATETQRSLEEDAIAENAESATNEDATTPDLAPIDDLTEKTAGAATAVQDVKTEAEARIVTDDAAESEAVVEEAESVEAEVIARESIGETERTADDIEVLVDEATEVNGDPEAVDNTETIAGSDESLDGPQLDVDEAITDPVTMESTDSLTTGGSLAVAGLRGEQGPPGPAGTANIEGSVGFLTRFIAPTTGGSSQIYDDGNNIGIGTTAPVQRLEVNGNIQIHEQNSSVAGLMITQSDGETGYIMHNRASTLTIGAGSVDRITIDGDGNVGFGVSRPSHPIEMISGAHVTSGGVWTNSSSRARKENIASLSLAEALNTLSDLEPVHFNYKNDHSESYVGFIAEDVPDLVATRDRDGLSSMDIVAILTKVVQEQQKQLEELEARLDQR